MLMVVIQPLPTQCLPRSMHLGSGHGMHVFGDFKAGKQALASCKPLIWSRDLLRLGIMLPPTLNLCMEGGHNSS